MRPKQLTHGVNLMKQTLTPPQIPTSIPHTAVAVAEKLLQSHAISAPGECPLPKVINAANCALRKRWVAIGFPEQIESFFDTKYPHTKEEAEAFLRYAKRTVSGVEADDLFNGLQQTLSEKPHIPGQKT
jgi:hypothetical protein